MGALGGKDDLTGAERRVYGRDRADRELRLTERGALAELLDGSDALLDLNGVGSRRGQTVQTVVAVETLALADVVDDATMGRRRAASLLDVTAILDTERLGAAPRAAHERERAEG